MMKPATLKLQILLALLCLLPISVYASGKSDQASSNDYEGTYSSSSPHWTHIKILDFARGVKYIGDDWRTPEDEHLLALNWVADHMDATEVAVKSFAFFGKSDPYYFNSPYFKSRNPSIQTFGYDMDIGMCLHEDCVNTQPDGTENPLNTGQTDLPEEYYLHFSTPVTVQYYGLDGKPFDWFGHPLPQVTFPGCSSLDDPNIKECRVKTYAWADYNYAANVKDSKWQQWYAQHLLDEANLPDNPIDGIFLDVHSPGFSLAMAWGYQTKVIPGQHPDAGGILEYEGLVPRDMSLWGDPSLDPLDTAYNADVSLWLTYLQQQFAQNRKFLLINTAGYSTYPLSQDQILAARGMTTELLNYPFGFYEGADQYQTFINLTKSLSQEPGAVGDLYGDICPDLSSVPTFNAGNYASADDRFHMWGLASYYVLKESPGSAGTIYFNPTLCIQPDSPDPLSFMNEWRAGYEKNVGQPVGDSYVIKQGKGSTVGCAWRDYKVFARQYENALVLVRPSDDRFCNDYGDTSAVTVPLPASLMLLNADGSFSSPIDSIQIRNAEAVILFNVPSANAPPVLDPIGGKTVNEGAALQFSVSATDPDGDALTYSAINLPVGATFIGQTFQWTPDFSQAGTYPVTFNVSDGSLSDSEDIVVTVNPVDRAPILIQTSDKSVNEGELLTFTIVGSDPDGDSLTYSAGTLPRGAQFDVAARVFSWTPETDQGGKSYLVTFTVSDGQLSASENVTIVVNDTGTIVTAYGVHASAGRRPDIPSFVTELGGTWARVNYHFADNTNPDLAQLLSTGLNLVVTFKNDDPSNVLITDYGTPDDWPKAGFPYLVKDTYETAIQNVLTPLIPYLSQGRQVWVQCENEVGDASVGPDGEYWRGTTDQYLIHLAAFEEAVHSLDPRFKVVMSSFTSQALDAVIGTPDYRYDYESNRMITMLGSPNYDVVDLHFYGCADDIPAKVQWIKDHMPPDKLWITTENAGPNQFGDIINTKNNQYRACPGYVDWQTDLTGFEEAQEKEIPVRLQACADNGASVCLWFSLFDLVNETDAFNHLGLLDQRLDDLNPRKKPAYFAFISYLAPKTGDNAPFLALLGPYSGHEGIPISFSVSGSDPDGNSLTYSATGLPIGASFSNGRFSWTPATGQAGIYPVTFVVTDGILYDAQTVILTITVDQAPVLDPIGDKSVNEGDLLSFTLTAFDPDGDSLTYSVANLPKGASLDAQTGLFTWTPAFDQAGSYSVTFTVSDGDASDSETITLTVNNVNRAPVLDPIGDRSITEGQVLSLTLSAQDPDGDPITYSTDPLPAGAQFDAASYLFTWTPTFDQAGSYPVTFSVSDGNLVDAETITLMVTDMNHTPVLDPIGDKSVKEGNLITFTVSASDPDQGDKLTYSVGALPRGAQFDPLSHVFSWTPDYNQADNYPVTFKVSDGDLSDSKDITITVNNVNRAPVLDPIGDKSVNEGNLLSFTLTASDPDGDHLTYSFSHEPSGATLDTETGLFSWGPDFSQAGTYPLTLIVSDGNFSDSEDIVIAVNPVNRPPVLNPTGNQSVTEGDLLSFTLTASDPDGDRLTFSASNLPGDAKVDTETGTFDWTPDSGQVGDHLVTFEVFDGDLSDTEDVVITVRPFNHPPVLDSIGDQSVAEGDLLTFTISALDPDEDALTYSFIGTLPAGSQFDAVSHLFSWTPTFEQAGSYTLTFGVSDGSLSDSETITITVNNVNRPPVLDPVGDLLTQEGDLLTFTVSASDPDEDLLSYSAVNLPRGAAFNSQDHTFIWMPEFNQSGAYSVTFQASDGDLEASETITIAVSNVNRAPVLGSLTDKTVTFGETLTFSVSASDPDEDPLTFTASNLPPGATFVNGVFNWTPADNTDATYANVHFEVNDGLLGNEKEITITLTSSQISDPNPPGSPPSDIPPINNEPPPQTPTGNTPPTGDQVRQNNTENSPGTPAQQPVSNTQTLGGVFVRGKDAEGAEKSVIVPVEKISGKTDSTSSNIPLDAGEGAFRDTGAPLMPASDTTGVPLAIISDVRLRATDTQLAIVWETDIPTTSWIEYGKDRRYGYFTKTDEQASVSHTLDITRFIPGLHYHFRIWSRDAYGNEVASKDHTFQTDKESLKALYRGVSSKRVAPSAASHLLKTEKKMDRLTPHPSVRKKAPETKKTKILPRVPKDKKSFAKDFFSKLQARLISF